MLDIADEEAPFVKEKTGAEKLKNKLKHKFLESDSSDSKYSNEDRQEKDHLMTGEEALLRSMKKLRNANKIV